MRKPLDILYNFHWIVPGEAARSAQPYMGMMGRLIDSNGLKGMINLRGHHPKFAWWRYETEICARHGVTHLDAMMDSRRLPLPEMLVALFDAFDAVPRPFVIKCSGGQDRTSLAAALYLVHRDGWTAMERAQRQFSRFPYLHFPRARQHWLRHFLAFAREASNGAPLGAWVRQDYTPDALARWLDANGLADAHNGVYEHWKPKAA